MGKRRRKQIRTAREQNGRAPEGQGESRYAQKVEAGRQMYGGPGKEGCCAHRVRLRDE